MPSETQEILLLEYQFCKKIMLKARLQFRSKSLERRLQIAKNNGDGLHSAIRRTLLCSRFIGLLPLSGLSNSSSDKLRFTLYNPYSVIYFISLFGQCLMFVTSFYWLLMKGISLTNITNSIFYTSSLMSSMILVNIGRSWPKLIKDVEAIEATLPPFTRNVTNICDITMALILVAAIVEHLLSALYGLTAASSCAGPNNIFETLYRFSMPWIFDYTEYAVWKAILSEVFSIQSTFMWSFNDLFIMVISIYLTEHITVHNDLLRRAVNHEQFSAMEFRLQYLNIVHLVRLVNKQVGIYILISFGSNLYWICTQLFNSLNKSQTGHFIVFQNHSCDHSQYLSRYAAQHGIEHTIYFTCSFSFIVLRTMLVLLLAARIHSNSNVPLGYLYALPSERFDVEVQRFISQISNIKVALSGLDFFYVTRTMILTLFGTIVTYELVLLQFNK